MKIYVNSRGYGGEEDYHWHVLDASGDRPVAIPLGYQQYVHGAMIYSEDESYIVGSFGIELGLVVTGIVSLSRKDFLQRAIHDTLLFIGSQTDDAILRGVVAQALCDSLWLPTLLDRAITFDKEQRFKIQRDVINEVLSHQNMGQANPDPIPLTRRLSDTSRRELGEELKTVRLPSHEGFLVVVTTIQSLQKLSNAGFWRALSKGVNSEENWEDRHPKKWRPW